MLCTRGRDLSCRLHEDGSRKRIKKTSSNKTKGIHVEVAEGSFRLFFKTCKTPMLCYNNIVNIYMINDKCIS